ncbi:hypothetical protein KSP40_PGU009833 [Platanthera guangdongensis]|uniref:Uncharacterized protein n=1 Tax=Platanthera guangdongensis TaxID=2320717 RepID=A0ABR2N0R2_9ASPA
MEKARDVFLAPGGRRFEAHLAQQRAVMRSGSVSVGKERRRYQENGRPMEWLCRSHWRGYEKQPNRGRRAGIRRQEWIRRGRWSRYSEWIDECERVNKNAEDDGA